MAVPKWIKDKTGVIGKTGAKKTQRIQEELERLKQGQRSPNTR